MPAYTKNPMVVAFWRFHRWLHRVTGGRLGGNMGAGQTLRLTTIGRKSGEPRDVMLTYVEDAGRYVVVASNLGQETHPQWFFNLETHPEVSVQIGRQRFAAKAMTLKSPEAEGLYDRFVEAESGYRDYQTRTDRRIPVVALVPHD